MTGVVDAAPIPTEIYCEASEQCNGVTGCVFDFGEVLSSFPGVCISLP